MFKTVKKTKVVVKKVTRTKKVTSTKTISVTPSTVASTTAPVVTSTIPPPPPPTVRRRHFVDPAEAVAEPIYEVEPLDSEEFVQSDVDEGVEEIQEDSRRLHARTLCSACPAGVVISTKPASSNNEWCCFRPTVTKTITKRVTSTRKTTIKTTRTVFATTTVVYNNMTGKIFCECSSDRKITNLAEPI